jgi:hypothetical protein
MYVQEKFKVLLILISGQEMCPDLKLKLIMCMEFSNKLTKCILHCEVYATLDNKLTLNIMTKLIELSLKCFLHKHFMQDIKLQHHRHRLVLLVCPTGDETVSMVSDTWSTDVLASDSETVEQSSERNFPTSTTDGAVNQLAETQVR